MKPKPLRIDWDLLEQAFSSQDVTSLYYLDLVTGQVSLDGEGADDGYGDEDGDLSHAGLPAPSMADDETRLAIRPPSVERKVGWLQQFLPEIEGDEPEMVAKIRAVIDHDDPSSSIGEALNQHPDGKNRWFMFREIKVQEMIERWLEDNSVPFIDPPPWR